MDADTDNLLDDDPARPRLLAAALVGVVLVLAVLAVVTLFPPGASGDGGVDDFEIASLQTEEPRCGTHRSENGSTRIHPVAGGYRLSINQTVPVAARDSELEARLDEVGPKRYLLELDRTPGQRRDDCYLEMRYNVSLNLTQRNEYTIVVLQDDDFAGMLYASPGQSGSLSTSLDPRPPGLNDTEWERALNASDRYWNETRGKS